MVLDLSVVWQWQWQLLLVGLPPIQLSQKTREQRKATQTHKNWVQPIRKRKQETIGGSSGSGSVSLSPSPETTPLLHSNSTRRLRRRRRRPSAQFAFGLAGQVFHVPVPSKHPRHSSDQQETT